MEHADKKYHRRSTRLQGYDYSQPGAYFVTICTRNGQCLFGDVVGEHMVSNDIGKMIQSTWNELPTRFPNIELDYSVVMPNHFHGIIRIVGAGLALPPGTVHGAPTPPDRNVIGPAATTPHRGAASHAPTKSRSTLGDIVCACKSISGIKTNRLLSQSGQSLWGRNYYEHIIRNQEDLNHIRQYIAHNPRRWEMDCENPKRRGAVEA